MASFFRDANSPLLDHVAQAAIHQLALRRAMAQPCASGPSVGEALTIAGKPMVDGSHAYVCQGSYGAPLALVLAALAPADSPVRLVGLQSGMAYMMAATHSARIFEIDYPRPLERDLLLVMLQLLFDRVENATFASHVRTDPLHGSAPAKVMLVTTRHNPWLTNLASDLLARTMELPLVLPSAYQPPPWNVPSTQTPVASGYAVYDIGAAAIPPGAREPTAGNSAVIRKLTGCQCLIAQLGAFLQPDGKVEPCDTPKCP